MIFEADAPGRHAAEEAGHGAVRLQALAHTKPGEHTHRWRYRWRWVNDPHPDVWDRNV